MLWNFWFFFPSHANQENIDILQDVSQLIKDMYYLDSPRVGLVELLEVSDMDMLSLSFLSC